MISLNNWTFDDYFARLQTPTDTANFILKARDLIASSRIETHDFFSRSQHDKGYLVEWAMQECVITNHFSLALFSLLGSIRNVHLRSLLLPVLIGEHSSIRDGYAYGAHPSLLANLIEDLGIDPSSLSPRSYTIEFINILFSEPESLAYRFGVLGIGNEALLVPEYKAVSQAFDFHFSRDVHRPFLKANIEEDKSHSKIMEEAAALICKDKKSEDHFLRGAKDGISARLCYYDAMLNYLTSIHR